VPYENKVKPLWILVIAYAIYIPLSLAQLLPPLLDVNISVFLPAIFALAHGVVRYKWRGSIAFFVICFVISNIFENVGVLTGFPFGPYHYTAVLGPKLFLVPLLIGPGYYGTGYLAWMLASVIVGEVRQRSSRFMTFAVPFIASFIMVSWDVCFDPDSATLNKQWIWHKGGGYFGVPLTNYLGWFLTVYVFLQVFSLYLRAKDPAEERTNVLPTPYWWQAITFYGLIGIGYPLLYFVAQPGTMTDATGKVWSVLDFRETSAMVSIYTMFFAVAVASIRLCQKRQNE
jgi:putative membrane protein